MRSTDAWGGGPEFDPGTGTIREAFAEEVGALGGEVTNVHEHGGVLFARAVLASSADVRAGDTVRAGVALRVVGAEVLVHPYTFRLVCANGAIAAHALSTRRVERVERVDVVASGYDAAVALEAVREAVRACAAPAVFEEVAAEMRTAAEREADVVLHLLPLLSRLAGEHAAHYLAMLLPDLRAAEDRTLFGLLNVVTAVARTEPDPAVRWDLESLGGSLPAALVRRPTAPSAAPGAEVLAQ